MMKVKQNICLKNSSCIIGDITLRDKLNAEEL